ncbi:MULTISPECIES: DUF1273 domain-containing protein [Ureibacillus]|jgi:uncharacterized phage-like protein YoqJ|uniref:UPF0398 protein HNR36_001781 n=1 Tax=Ureibacillus thermosphaericus TaxID=51173 RepID=A0A840PXG6_URETH|nr:DUF1273 domain-containing protein [Ureibacillus thermosphaericus]MBB5149391.1 putative phage-like protein YoqJ [Ureibacillus thermosphaericus]NKZ32156.1 DUF1273 domain-containing protein [Ureibacillus thermosphaericus]
MIQSLYVSGYRPHELGIFNEKHPGIQIIKKAIENELRSLIEDGLEWVIVSGQLGVEIWTAEVVIELKNEFPQLKYSVITPFLDIEKNWNEQRQQQYAYIISQADFVTSITKRPYEAPWQFVEKDKFIIQNTDALLLVYDEEHEGSPKYLKRLVEKYMERNPYELFVITSYDLQIIAEELERAEW